MKRYLFFLRHFNDIDNIAPAIYFFLEQSENHRADVILYHEGYDFRNDPNLLFLKSSFGERFSYAWLGDYYGISLETAINAAAPVVDPKRKMLVRCKQGVKTAAAKAGLPVDSMVKRYRKKRAGLSLSMNDVRVGNADSVVVRKGLERILSEHVRPSLVIFDINRSPLVQGILDNLRVLGIKRIVCLPVSPLINYNVLRATKHVNVFSDEFKKLHDYSGFDALGYVDGYFVQSYNKLLPLIGITSSLKDKTTYLGSIRFCPEWLSVREQLIQPYNRETSPGKIKLAVLPSLAESNVHWDEFLRCLSMIRLFPDYDVVVKAHPRLKGELGLGSADNLSIDNAVDSTALINWADAVLFWSTSVAIEGYIKGKCMICLSYMVCNRNLYAKYDAGYVAGCRDDLLSWLIKFSKDKEAIPYNQEGIEQFLKSCILPQGQSVPDRYLEFMLNNEY